MSSLRHKAAHGVCPGRRLTVRVQAAFSLRDGKGTVQTFSKPSVSVGSSGADVVVAGSGVAKEHALIIQKGKQTFLKPLQGESLLDDSRCWKDGVSLRPGVSYVLASGCAVAFGSEASVFTIEFEEGGGSNPLMEMMMKGMVAGSSPEVKKALGGM
ncbi:hypothetical protein HYH03_012138 [Edaphochlamys debaryana]|uniref:FHA domain-containing protein n=1 Tax=Edaphochlamys debaryana TaxID=47281 RepID=A0A835XVV4_9CHLO|nr:hypothetical protein HYH03_012138 [Edaphochlamys debaryana]|eukprot:KAG2489306.1 hypothetical protein HYH03_012138 [Edaphochlamys debaryana]